METKHIIENINKVIVGKRDKIEYVLAALLGNGHVLLEDVPGTGKTVLAKSLAASLNVSFSRIQFTPDLLPSDVTGLTFYNQKEGEFVTRRGPVFSGIVLADEINRATPRTQSSLLECMEERQVTIDGESMKLDDSFFVIATQNPIELSGTFPLPEAQLDRFAIKISLGYPTHEESLNIMKRFAGESPFDDLQPVCSAEDINKMKKEAKEVYIHPLVLEYMTSIVEETRNNKKIRYGVSPRGLLVLMRVSQALASIRGLDYVTPDIVKELAPIVLCHRLVTENAFTEEITPADILADVLAHVAVPTEDFKKQ